MKTVLITGGSRGIGAATAEKFCKEGYSVIVNYCNSGEAAMALRDKLRQFGDVHLFRADVSSVEQVAQMFDFVRSVFHRLDVLVNNAGICISQLCQDVTEQDYDNIMSVNAKGAFFCCKEAFPQMLNQGFGSVVNVSSIWGLKGAAGESVYCMSKHALVGLTKSLAAEWADCGVNVNCVCPPIVLTDMCKHYTGQELAQFCAEHGARVFSPQEVADDIFRLAESGLTGEIWEER